MAVINHAANNMSQATGRRMMHGLLMGHIDTIREVLAAYRTKDRY